MNRLKGKVAIVTGASSGIGFATAELFAEEGAIVVAGDIQPPRADYAHPVETVPLDVTSEEAWEKVVADTERAHGGVDVLVNNAGTGTAEGIADLSLADWDRVIRITQTGPFLGMRAVIPVMRSQAGGSIVNISSIWGTVGFPNLASYHAAKGAVRTLTKNAAVTYASDGIRVNSVHPGFTDTPATQAQDAAVSQEVIDMTPLGRAAHPREIANGCLFLASEDSSFVTGSELVVDGGYLAQ